jgi:hypothetical protein
MVAGGRTTMVPSPRLVRSTSHEDHLIALKQSAVLHLLYDRN